MIEIKDLNITYDGKTLIRNGETIFYKGRLHLITGKSGSGKSTLLYRIGLIAEDGDYKYFIDKNNVLLKNEFQKSHLKRFNISYVLQDNSLFEQYDVLGNLQLYSEFVEKKYTMDELRTLLKLVNLDVPLEQSVSTLSGGEKQRLAIACGLCKDAEIFILDEPTSSLDESNSTIVFEVLRKLAHEFDKCIIIASHSTLARKYADITYHIKNGKLVNYNNQCNEDAFLSLKKREDSKIPLKFYMDYIKYFHRKFKNINRFILIIMILTILTSLISINIIDFYTNKSKEAILKIGDNQLFITDSKQNLFVDDLNQPVREDLVEKIRQEKECLLLSPYVRLVTSYLEKEVYVLPYYDENDFTYSELCKLDTRDNKGIYMSYSLYILFMKNNYNPKVIDLDLMVSGGYEKGKEITKIKEQAFPVNAALKEGFVSSYYQSGKYFVYMYYKDILQIYDELYDSNDFLGYTVITENYKNLITLQNKLKNLPIGINSGFIDTNSIDNIVETGVMYRNILVATIIFIFTLLLLVTQMNYFYKRNREYALLKINGLSYQELVKLTMLETISKLLISSFISLVLYIAIILILRNELITINIMTIIQICFISSITILISIFLAIYLYLRNMIPENILRK